jgi:uncharacterized membrane protein YheB (UPF0754 family)
MGKLVGEELVSFKDIEQKIIDPKNIEQLMPFVETHIDHFLRVKLADEMPMISMFIGDRTINQMKGIFMQELATLFPQMMENYMGKLKNDLDLEQIVIEKVSGFSSDKLEQILLSIMQKEFRFVEIIGAVLGFIIGLFQVLITFLS